MLYSSDMPPLKRHKPDRSGNMKGIVPFFFSLILFISLLGNACMAQQHPIAEVHKLISTGIDQVLLQNYSGAYKTFTDLDKKYPNIPLGKIFLAANQITKEYEFNLPFSEQQILRWLEAAEQQADQLLKEKENDVWNNYYKGLAVGYQAYYYGLQESWVKTFTNGLAAKKYFERCIELNPGFTDASVALGAYKFWKSEKTDGLNWIFKDEKAEGIKLLQASIVKRSYQSFLAVHNLFWIYIYRKEYKNAYNVILPAIKRYPESRFFRWDYARVMEEIDREKVFPIYEDLLATYRRENTANRCNEITLLYMIAKNYYTQGNTATAVTYLRQIPAKKTLTAHEIEKLGKRLDKIKTLKTQCGVLD
jgi:hypothetical protein